jgi:hypothetical protein
MKVALGDEDHDKAGLLDVILQRADVLQVVDVEEDGHAREQQAELPLDRGALVLPRAPDVREEEVPLVPFGKLKLRPVTRRDEPECGHPRGIKHGQEREWYGEAAGANDADEEAASDSELVKVQAIVQLASVEGLCDGLDLDA